MKTKILILGIVVLFLFASVSAVQTDRYLIKSDNAYIKGLYGVHHEFDEGFTANLHKGQLIQLEKQGIEFRKVEMYQFTDKPICGDGIIQPSEKCGEEGLANCSDGYVCSSTCKCVADDSEEPEEPIRTQFPDNQIPYGVSMINGGFGGDGVNVAVLDSGAMPHPDFVAHRIMCVDTSAHPVKVTDTCSDDLGHGTHVMGTVGAYGGEDGLGIYGVAPESNLMMVKVGSFGALADDLAEGIYYATDNGANIITMSLGGLVSDPLIYDAIKYAYANGVLIIASAGNGGEYNDTVSYPARYEEVIAVGAIDENKELAFFSSRGAEVELVAPGVNIESTAGGMDLFITRSWYVYKSGTSMSAPHIAGLAAKVWKGNAQDTRAYLQSIAIDLGDEGRDNLYGFGVPIAP